MMKFLSALLMSASACLALGNGATAVGSPSYAAAKFSTGLSSTSDTNYATTPVGAVTAFSASTGATIEMWLKLPSGTGTYVSFFPGDSNTFIGAVSGQFAASFNGFSGTTSSGILINDNVWHHCAAVLSGGTTLKLFVDGVLGVTATGTYSTTAPVGGRIGRYNAGTFFWPGSIDEIAIWNSAKYSANFTPPVAAYAGSELGLESLYHLDSNLVDSTTPASTSSLVLLPASTAIKYSPGNWSGDTGRAGSVSRTTWNPGAYAEFYWTQTSSSLTAFLMLNNATAGSTIATDLDGVMTILITVSAAGNVAIPVTGSGAHVLIVHLNTIGQSATWDLTNSVLFTGLILDTNSTAVTAPAARPWVQIVGDSISAGVQTNGASTDNFVDGWDYQIGQILKSKGYDYSISSCGYNSWIHTGNVTNDVPAWYSVASGVYSAANSRWNKINSTTSILDSNSQISSYGATGTTPVAIMIVFGVNEAIFSLSTSDMSLSIQGYLAAARIAAPNAKIVVQMPWNMRSTGIYANSATYVPVITTAVSTYLAGHIDGLTQLADFGVTLANDLAGAYYGNGTANSVHPGARGHSLIAPHAAQALFGALASGSAVGYSF